ncbi:hypothetical protein TNCV_99661 [Trichonephila clavipes]|nr:hypothetical protein TNCV_99661 [Trichonephila clavipes]
MSKTLALKASERIGDIWTDRAIKVCGLDGLWEIRRCKGQNEVLSIKHLSIHLIVIRFTPQTFWSCKFSKISSVDTCSKSAADITPRE